MKSVKSALELAAFIGAAAVWRDGRAEIDIPLLLSGTLTHKDDLLVFVADTFTVDVSMEPLLRLRKLRRKDLTGWVDAKGLHIRWHSGGLNLRSIGCARDRIVVPLRRCPVGDESTRARQSAV